MVTPSTVIVPYVKDRLRPQTKNAVIRQRHSALFCEHLASDPESYARVIIEASHRPGNLVINEQDIVPPPGAINQLLRCWHPWCYHLVELKGRLTPATLGLAKFGWHLQFRYPNWAELALRDNNDPFLTRLMHEPDMAIANWMDAQGIRAHVHNPPPVHLHWPGTHGW